MTVPWALRRYLAELVGTFFLVLAGVGTLVIGRFTGVIGPVGIAAAFAVTYMVVIAAVGRLSGAHLNPAVTVAFAVSRDFPWRHVPGYILAQCLGGILGAAAVGVLFGRAVDVGTTVPFPGAAAPAFFAEALFAFLLMFVAQSVARRGKLFGPTAAVAAGAALLVGILVAAPLSGGSLNPARSLGTAVVARTFDGHWLYWVGPILGCILGALAARGLGLPALRLPIREPLPPPPREREEVPAGAAEVPA